MRYALSGGTREKATENETQVAKIPVPTRRGITIESSSSETESDFDYDDRDRDSDYNPEKKKQFQQLQRQVNSMRYALSGGTRVNENETQVAKVPVPTRRGITIKSSSSETESDFDYDDSDRDPDYNPEKKKQKRLTEDILIQPFTHTGHQEVNKPLGASQRKESTTQMPDVERGRERKRITPEERRRRDEAARNHWRATKQTVKGGCNENCKLSCHNHFTMEKRTALCAKFWSLEWSHRRAFLQQHVRKTAVKRRRVAEPEKSRRSHTFAYHLSGEHGEVKVCKKMFEDTLNIGDKAIRNALHSESLHDMRGKHTPAHKFDHEDIKADIERYHPCLHHYRREHAPLRRYLPSDVSITDMHKTYNQSRQSPVSYPLYHRVFKEMNISLAQLGNEECEDCQSHHIHIKSRQCPDPCDICQRHDEHKTRAFQARQAYQNDAAKQKTSEDCIVSADLQKVIMLPRMEMFKTVLFTRRICLFNETFAAVGSKKKNTTPKRNSAFLWHEGVMGRKDEDVASTFWQFISENRDVTSLTIWLDNCAGQNKNWTLFTVLATAVN